MSVCNEKQLAVQRFLPLTRSLPLGLTLDFRLNRLKRLSDDGAGYRERAVPQMHWYSLVEQNSSLDVAVDRLIASVDNHFNGEPLDLAILFVSGHNVDAPVTAPQRLMQAIKARVLIGCSAAGVVGNGLELEQTKAVSLLVAQLPNVEIGSFYCSSQDNPRDYCQSLQSRLGCDPSKRPSFIILADPFSADAEAFVHELDDAYPDCIKVGGMASGADLPGDNRLFLDDQIFREGLIGISLSGAIDVGTIVAQGCRPIGQPMFVTQADQNLITELDGHAPRKVLEETYKSLSTDDQKLFQTSLFLGVVMLADRTSYQQGDFLIRNILGFESSRGSVAVGTPIEKNSVVQFHLRDAHTSTNDLAFLLKNYRDTDQPTPYAALLFSCVGRGKHLYGKSHHDSTLLRDQLGEIPIGGFFCNGEIGPVGDHTYLHGYTSSFALFRPKLS